MIIEFKNVSAGYTLPDNSFRTVLENTSLRIEQGEMVYLTGPTGSGKSTLLRLLYADLLPTAGVVRVGDYSSDTLKAKDVPYLRRSIGVVFQDFQLLADRSLHDNVAFALYATGKSGSAVKSRVVNVLSLVGLAHKRRRMPHEISGGERQRGAIARAIVNEPWVLLADEPTGNLDPGVADEIMQLLLGLHKQGMTLLMATHDYRLIRENPHRTLAFLNGQLVEIDPMTLRT